MFDPSAVFYMEKLAVGPEAADVIDITAPVGENIAPGRQGQGRSASPTSRSCILDRPRHARADRARSATAGARIRFISDGDVAGAIMAARAGTGVDLLLGIGGTPEGIIAAAALKCMGGAIQGKLWPQTDEERARGRSTPGTTWTGCSPPTTWCAATTSSSAPPASPTATCSRGVRYRARWRTTQSIVMRSKSGTVRDDRRRTTA